LGKVPEGCIGKGKSQSTKRKNTEQLREKIMSGGTRFWKTRGLEFHVDIKGKGENGWGKIQHSDID
jgi:hypothetical protein